MYADQVNVISVQRCNYPPGNRLEKHSHTYFHLFYILEGKGTMLVGGQTFDLQPKKLYLCAPFCEHELYCSETTAVKTLEIKFFIQNPNLLAKICALPGEIAMDTAPVRAILEAAFDEALSKDHLYREIIHVNILTMLLKILQSRAKHPESANKPTPPPEKPAEPAAEACKGIDFTAVIRYMQNNLHLPVKLARLAREAGLNATYFCRVFKEETGASPMQYVNNLRLRRAKELLLESDLNITEIAEAVGFQSLHYFSRYFKEREQMPPQTFRQRMKNNRYIYLEKQYFEA